MHPPGRQAPTPQRRLRAHTAPVTLSPEPLPSRLCATRRPHPGSLCLPLECEPREPPQQVAALQGGGWVRLRSSALRSRGCLNQTRPGGQLRLHLVPSPWPPGELTSPFCFALQRGGWGDVKTAQDPRARAAWASRTSSSRRPGQPAAWQGRLCHQPFPGAKSHPVGRKTHFPHMFTPPGSGMLPRATAPLCLAGTGLSF